MNREVLGARFGLSIFGFNLIKNKSVGARREVRIGLRIEHFEGNSRGARREVRKGVREGSRELARIAAPHPHARSENSSRKRRVFRKFIGKRTCVSKVHRGKWRVFRKFNGENGVCFEKRASTCRCVTLEVYSLRIKRVALLPK